jgi:tripartite ATP-independent transporter DctM subunit
MILFASVTQVSIGKMFAGGLIPGLIMSGLFIVYIVTRCYLQPEMGPTMSIEESGGSRNKLIAIRDAILAFLLIFMVLGSILFGIATPTEAAAVGAVGATLIALVYGKLTLGVIKEASIQTMRLTGMCVWILIGATVFSNFHMLMGAQKLLTSMTLFEGISPMGIIAMMQLSMLVMGCFIDEWIIVLICGPLYTPIAVALGFDPIWFGILMILNIEIAIQTPPYGFALFYLKGIAPPDCTMFDIYKSIGPFVTIKMCVLALVMFLPDLATWLPRLIFDG